MPPNRSSRATAHLVAATLLALTAHAVAQADFSFEVTDETKTDTLHVQRTRDISVYKFGSNDPSLHYSIRDHILGINQPELTLTSERTSKEISRQTYAAFLAAASRLPTKPLDPPSPPSPRQSTGWIKIHDTKHRISAPPDSEIRLQWQTLIDEFLLQNTPTNQRERVTRTIQGETVEPTPVDFPTLLASPSHYDGKRIRISGYYDLEFEGSSFAATPEDIDNYDQALWLGGSSTFADPKDIDTDSEVYATIDGTFELGPGGHLGLWVGELQRITSFRVDFRTIEEPKNRPLRSTNRR